MSIRSLYHLRCPACEQEFESNHRNRRYCSKRCQVDYNNLRATQKREASKAISDRHTEMHWKNREVLQRFVSEGDVPLSVLKAEGFDYRFVTAWQIGKDENGKAYHIYYVFDYRFVVFNRQGKESILRISLANTNGLN